MKEQISTDLMPLLSKGVSLILPECSGDEIIIDAKQTFQSIDPNFKNYYLNKPDPVTGEAYIDVRAGVMPATFAEIFNPLSKDLNTLCLSQHQIKVFCKKYPNWLAIDGAPTFFLYKGSESIFVMYVYTFSSGLDIRIRRFFDNRVWGNLSFDRYIAFFYQSRFCPQFYVVTPSADTLGICTDKQKTEEKNCG